MAITGIGLHKDFLSPLETGQLLTYCRNPHTVWRRTSPHDPWDDRTIPHAQARPDIRELLVKIRARVIESVVTNLKIERPLYADSLTITRWRVGEDQAPHADSENVDGSPHLYPWRNYGAIMYLNTVYEGGEIYFPTLDLKPKIEADMLAFFPGTVKFLHGVTPVRSGIRYTVATFLTHDEAHKDWA